LTGLDSTINVFPSIYIGSLSNFLIGTGSYFLVLLFLADFFYFF